MSIETVLNMSLLIDALPSQRHRKTSSKNWFPDLLAHLVLLIPLLTNGLNFHVTTVLMLTLLFLVPSLAALQPIMRGKVIMPFCGEQPRRATPVKSCLTHSH